MSESTAISWCDSTFNPWIGCQDISPACKNCYAAAWAKRYGRDFAARTHTSAANWKLPLRWEREHAEFFAEYGRRRRVFCASLADVFDNQVPPAWRAELFALIASTPHLDWLLLTKRIGNVPVMLEAPGMQKGGLPSNVWLGATVVTQAEADRDIPKLAAVRARVRFLSIEPMLGPVNLRLVTKTWSPGRCNHCCNGDRCDDPSHYDRQRCPHCHGTGGQPISQVICGGESGPGARPAHPDWFRSLRDQCAAAGVPFHLKQHGEWTEVDTGMPAPLVAREGDPEFNVELAKHDGFISLAGHFVTDPDDMLDGVAYRGLIRPGKKAAGRLLDGVEHNGFPEPSA